MYFIDAMKKGSTFLAPAPAPVVDDALLSSFRDVVGVQSLSSFAWVAMVAMPFVLKNDSRRASALDSLDSDS